MTDREIKMSELSFAEKLNKLIEEKSINVVDLGRYFSANRTTVSRWQQGKSLPHPILQELIIKYLEEK
jgi:2,4-dienoyl-CoA reductase-like NADH-dependent reductase (Old Yellow Enzyme family)